MGALLRRLRYAGRLLVDSSGILPVHPEVVPHLLVIELALVLLGLFLNHIGAELLLLELAHLLHEDVHLLHVDHQLVRVLLVVGAHLRLELLPHRLHLLFVGGFHQLQLLTQALVLLPYLEALLRGELLGLTLQKGQVLLELVSGQVLGLNSIVGESSLNLLQFLPVLLLMQRLAAREGSLVLFLQSLDVLLMAGNQLLFLSIDIDNPELKPHYLFILNLIHSAHLLHSLPALAGFKLEMGDRCLFLIDQFLKVVVLVVESAVAVAGIDEVLVKGVEIAASHLDLVVHLTGLIG
jgi:hypothetical protein